MTLKAVLFDFNGVIINDEPIHKQLIDQILLEENIRPVDKEYKKLCLGRSDRFCLLELLQFYGRVVSENYLNQIIRRKAQRYQEQISNLETLPIYPGLKELLIKLEELNLKLAIVSGALRSEIEIVLTRTELKNYFSVLVGGDEIRVSKPAPDGYLLAVERLNQLDPNLHLSPSQCLIIEDSLPGIQAGKNAQINV
ncbi:MAG TPA: HAD family phosphatase, partial [Allocoleopsis sp.]